MLRPPTPDRTPGPTPDENPAATFERHRRELTGLAYRMVGALSEAQDIVQDAYLRWQAATQGDGAISHPRAFLYKIVTRLCVDHLKSARARREIYPGTWLPEPVLDPSALQPPTTLAELAHDLSFAVMTTLERLSPAERAAFLLHDIFDLAFSDVADVIGQNEATCRQLAVRARDRLQAARPRFQPSSEQTTRLLTAFVTAARDGDVAALRALCAEEAVFYSDGGGRVSSALKPVVGPDRIARFVVGAARKFAAPRGAALRFAPVNGLPGLILATATRAVQTFAFELDEQGRILRIYSTRNPDKLRHVPACPP